MRDLFRNLHLFELKMSVDEKLKVLVYLGKCLEFMNVQLCMMNGIVIYILLQKECELHFK